MLSLPTHCGSGCVCTAWDQKGRDWGYCGQTGKKTTRDHKCDVPDPREKKDA